jgi:predicted acylesterase/phospholipase RssA
MTQRCRLRGVAIASLALMATAGLAPTARSADCDGCLEWACSPDLPVPPPPAPAVKSDPIVTLLEQDVALLPTGQGKPTRPKLGPALSLSGGGSHGAWGAGVLYGRHLRGEPRFDVVTGVSTGAVMATLVLIEDYAELKSLYTNVQESDVQRSPWPWDDGFRRALYTRKPLRELMECALHTKPEGSTDTRFQLVQKAREARRKLVLGTIDMDTGQFCAWDMTCIACKGHDDLYLEVTMASANAPVVGPPVPLDYPSTAHRHVDGGVRAQIFAQKIVGSSISRGRDVYFLVNGKLEGGVQDMQPGWDGGMLPIVPIAERAIELLEHEALQMALHYYQSQIAANQEKKKKKDKTKLYLSRTPQDFDLTFRKREFPREKMGELFEAGCQWGKNMATWPEWTSWWFPQDNPPKVWPDQPTDCEPDAEPPEQLCTQPDR